MSEYGESLEIKDLCSIYRSLGSLSKDVLISLKEKGYFYKSSDCSYEAHRLFLSSLTSKEDKQFFKNFVGHMRENGYALKYNGKIVSADLVLKGINSNKIHTEEDSGDESCYFEYSDKNKKGLYIGERLLDTIYLFCLLVEVCSEKPEKIIYSGFEDIVIYDKTKGTIDTIRRLVDLYAMGSDSYTYINLKGIVCYEPHIIEKYISSDNSQDTNYNGASLRIGLSYKLDSFDKKKVYSVFDEFCPCLIGGYQWSKPKSLPKGSEEFLKQEMGNNLEYTAHLYMKNGSPTVDFLFKDADFDSNSCVHTDSLTDWIVNTFGNNIKEVYIVFNDGKLKGNEVIARKNSDKELTLTIY